MIKSNDFSVIVIFPTRRRVRICVIAWHSVTLTEGCSGYGDPVISGGHDFILSRLTRDVMTEQPAVPRPAATLILLRKTSRHPLETLMVVRQQAIEFAGGAIVFPGGCVDTADHAHASACWPTAPR